MHENNFKKYIFSIFQTKNSSFLVQFGKIIKFHEKSN